MRGTVIICGLILTCAIAAAAAVAMTSPGGAAANASPQAGVQQR